MKSKALRGIALALGGLVLFLVGIAVGHSSPPSHPAAAASIASITATHSATAAPTSAAPSPSATPSPNGTYQGACSYTLGSDPANGSAVATGDVQVTNTGNIGTVDHVTITWPQQGYSPLSQTKTIRLAAGGSDDVQFHMPLSYDQLSNLQNWQTGHNYSDGCTYKAAMVSTFGVPQ